MRSRLVLLGAVLLSACGQEIVTVQCHDADTSNPADAGMNNNEDAAVGMDRQDNPNPDATTGDVGAVNPDATVEEDGGMTNNCANTPYCITSLAPSKEIANVREAITFTPVISNPQNIALTFSSEASEVTSERRAGLPPLTLSQITLTYSVDNAGVITFLVAEVPPFFTTTTFVVKLHARGNAMPAVVAEGRVTINGNVLMSGYSSVYSYASDGRPARSISLTSGRIIEGTSFIREPKTMLLARDGSLLVLDSGTTPERLRRFELSGENVHLGDFEYQNSMMEPYIYADQDGTGLTQLMDGRFALVVYHYNRTPDSAIVLWNEDGTYDRTIDCLNPTTQWQGISASKTANELLVVENAGAGRLFRMDPNNGNELGVVATDIASAWGVLAMPSGHTYVGITAGIIRVTPQGGKTMISMLMSGAADYWNFLTPFAGGKIIAARDYSSDYSNIAVIDGTTGLGWFRQQMVGGPTLLPYGLAYLE